MTMLQDIDVIKKRKSTIDNHYTVVLWQVKQTVTE